MIIYIKDPRTYQTRAMYDAYDREEVIGSIWAEYSRFYVATVPRAAAGDLLICGGRLYVVESITTYGEAYEIDASDAARLFARRLPSTYEDGADIESFAVDHLTADYIDVLDPVYAMPWLTATAMGSTPWIKPQPDNEGLWSMRSYLTYVRRVKSVFARWTIGRDGATVTVGRFVPPAYNLDFSSGRYIPEEITTPAGGLARITTVAEDGTVADFWRLADGSITDELPISGRASGGWETLALFEDEDAAGAAASRFAEASGSDKITFYSADDLDFYGSVNIRLPDGRVVSSYIASKKYISARGLYFYRCGSAATTLTDDMQEVI